MLNFVQTSNGLCVVQNKIKISQLQQQQSVLQHTCVLQDHLIHWLQRAICASLTLPEWEQSHKSPLVSMEDALDRPKISEEQPNSNTLPTTGIQVSDNHYHHHYISDSNGAPNSASITPLPLYP